MARTIVDAGILCEPRSDDVLSDVHPKVYAVYHICTAGSWKTVVDRQLKLLISSGLYEKLEALYISIVGKQADVWMPPICIQEKSVVKFRSKNPNVYEKGALRILQSEFALDQSLKSSPHDKKIKIPSTVCEDENFEFRSFLEKAFPQPSYCLYFHTKGISHYSGSRTNNINDWANLMEYACIAQHELCIQALRYGFHTCGVNLTRLPTWHYSGNFWWANVKYIPSLAPLEVLEQRFSDSPQMQYLVPEMWIGYTSFLPDQAGFAPPLYALDKDGKEDKTKPVLRHSLDCFSQSLHDSFIALKPPSDRRLPHYSLDSKLNNNNMFCLLMTDHINHYNSRFPLIEYKNLLIQPWPNAQDASFKIVSASWGSKDITREIQKWTCSHSFVRFMWRDRNFIFGDPEPGKHKEFRCTFQFKAESYLQLEKEIDNQYKPYYESKEIIFGYCGGSKIRATQRT